jgi:hypothetical protein
MYDPLDQNGTLEIWQCGSESRRYTWMHYRDFGDVVCGKRPSGHPVSFHWVNGLIKYRLHPVKGGRLLVAQLVEALHYKPEGCGFDSRWCHWNFPLT